MTTKKDFSEPDWTRIVRAPFVAGLSISLADPGGPIEMAKETAATLRSATNPPSREELLADVALDIQQMVQQRHNPVKSFKLAKDGTAPGQQILAELAAVHGIVAAHATAEETKAFSAWLLASAQDAANAAKEGGFMGFGATLVSDREQAMLEQVRAAVGL